MEKASSAANARLHGCNSTRKWFPAQCGFNSGKDRCANAESKKLTRNEALQLPNAFKDVYSAWHPCTSSNQVLALLALTLRLHCPVRGDAGVLIRYCCSGQSISKNYENSSITGRLVLGCNGRRRIHRKHPRRFDRLWGLYQRLRHSAASRGLVRGHHRRREHRHRDGGPDGCGGTIAFGGQH